MEDLYKVHVEGYDRVDPVTGQVEHVKEHEDKRRKAVAAVPSDMGKPSSVKPGLPGKAKQQESPEAQIPLTEAIFKQDRITQRHQIKNADLESVISYSDKFKNAYIEGDLHKDSLQTYLRRLGEDQKALLDFYNSANNSKDFITRHNSLDLAREVGVLQRASIAKKYAVDNMRLEALQDITSKEPNENRTSIHEMKSINRMITALTSSSKYIDPLTKQALGEVEALKVMEDQGVNIDYLGSTEATMRGYELSQMHKTIDKMTILNEGASKLEIAMNIALNEAVAKSMYNMTYYPSSYASRQFANEQLKLNPEDKGHSVATNEGPKDINDRASLYVTTAKAASLAYFNSRGIPEVTLYKEVTLPNKYPQLQALDDSRSKQDKDPDREYTALVEEDFISNWTSDVSKLKPSSSGKNKTVVVKTTVPAHAIISSKHTNKALAKDDTYIIASPGKRRMSYV